MGRRVLFGLVQMIWVDPEGFVWVDPEGFVWVGPDDLG